MTLRKIIGLKLGAFRFIVHTKELSHLSLDHALVEDTTAVCFYVEINSMQNCWWFILWEVSIYVSSCTKIIIIWRAMMTDPEAPLTQTEEENQTTWFFESHLKLSPFFKVGTQSVFFFFFAKKECRVKGPKTSFNPNDFRHSVLHMQSVPNGMHGNQLKREGRKLRD